MPPKRTVGIAHLTYGAISEVFCFLDADTLLQIHSAAKDSCKFTSYFSYENPKQSQLVKRKFTPSGNLPEYLRAPLYVAIARNLKSFKAKLAAVPEADFYASLSSEPNFDIATQHLSPIEGLIERLETPCEIQQANY